MTRRSRLILAWLAFSLISVVVIAGCHEDRKLVVNMSSFGKQP